MHASVEDLLFAELGERLEPRLSERIPVIGRRAARKRRERDGGPLLIGALQALGLVSAEEAARWQSRLTEALSSREDKSEGWTPEARARGEAHLQALRSDGRDSSRRAALESYVSTGVLGPEEAKEWEQDVDLADLEDEEETRADAFKGELGWLHAVVLGPPNPIGGLRLVAAELYDGGVVIRWHRLRTAPGHDLCADGGEIARLRDELGTDYALLQGGAGQSGEALAGSWWFEPGAPEGCTRLELEAPGARFGIELDPR